MSAACVAALAGAWSVGVPLERALNAEGALEVPGGVAIRLVSDAGPLAVRSADGQEPPQRGLADGLLVPAAGATRALEILAPEGAKVRVHSSEDDGEATAWSRWEQASARALRRDEPLPHPPGCLDRLRLSVQLRADAVQDRGVAWLGLLYDAAPLRPVGSASHVLGPELPLAPALLRGPGVALLRTRPPAGPLRRYTLIPAVAGQPAEPLSLASTGSAPLTQRAWVPPGESSLDFLVSDPEVSGTISLARLKPRLTDPRLPRASSGLAAAELALLRGDRQAAREGFRAQAEAEGAAGELARARLVLLEEDPGPALDRALARPRSEAGAQVLAEAALARADRLPPERVLALVLEAPDPDPLAVARWLNGLGGLRPRGLALLATARRDVPLGPALEPRALREAAWATSWTRLLPAAEALAAPSLHPEGPGVPRVLLRAGEQAELTLPPLARGRLPVLRLRAAGPARYRVDGQPWTAAAAGDLDVALPPGPHLVGVEEGELLLLDAETVLTGGARVFEWPLARLPARWELPDPGVGAELRVQMDSPAPLTLSFDDGRTEQIAPGADGSLPLVLAGPWARSVEILGPEGALAGLSLRAARSGAEGAEATPLLPVGEEEGIAALQRLSVELAQGRAEARLARAEVLGRLGLLGPARQDLAVAARDPALRAEASRLWRRVAAPVPSAPAPGPQTVAAAFAAAGEATTPLPTEAEALETAAARLGQPALEVAAAADWLARGRLPEAVAALLRAGPAGADLLGSTLARTRWSSLSRADRSAGLVEVELSADPAGSQGSLWRRALDALFPSPWPAGEDLLLRNDWGALLRHRGTQVEVELLCRDERAEAGSCQVELRSDAERRTVEVAPSLEPTRIGFTLPPGAHELEIGPPGRGLALRARATVDGVLVPLRTRQLALRAEPARPIGITVAGPALLRVEVVRGELRSGGQTARPDEPLLVPLLDRGPVSLELSGEGEALLAVGELLPLLDEPPAPPERAPTAALSLEALAPLYARAATPSAPERLLPRDGGTTRIQLSGGQVSLPPVGEPWRAAEVEAAWMRSFGADWLGITGWARGPGWGGGLSLGAARSWGGGWAGASLDGGASRGLTDAAGSLALTLRARQDLELPGELALRLSGRLGAGWWSEAPATPVDPRAWSRWGHDHPVNLRLGAEAIATPTRDLRASLSLGASSNAGPSLDGLSAAARASWLLGDAWVLDGRLTTKLGFADDHRAQTSLSLEPALGAEWATWLDRTRRLSVRGRLGLDQGRPELWAGVALWWTGGRGLEDLAPDSAAFKTARGRP